uniref:Uncharacterized protein n=1 Tax=viral metagenome TaxID=1070528 RepID=A0A6C0HF49_9ZZZZ
MEKNQKKGNQKETKELGNFYQNGFFIKRCTN